MDASTPLLYTGILRTGCISNIPRMPHEGASPPSGPLMFAKCKTNEQRGSSWAEEFPNTWPTESGNLLVREGLVASVPKRKSANPTIVARPPSSIQPFLFLVKQNAFRSCSMPGGNHECCPVYLEFPENAPSHITLLQDALHSSLWRSGDKGQGEKLPRSNYLTPHIQV